MTNKSCKLVVLGDSGVGKTTLIHKYINNEFRADFKSTIGADFTAKTIELDNQTVDLQIWDTAGEVRFHSVGAAFYRGTDACILVYDVTSRDSFNRLKMWQEDLYTKSGIDDRDGFPLIVFGNKSDLDENREISTEEAEQWSAASNIPVVEVSAKSGQNIEAGFEKLVSMFLTSSIEKRKMMEPITIKINQGNNEKKCC
ncbi:small GTP-binding protein [Tritrichomonas foetus]|uniref:Ras-related protein Rab-7b n=1 Tax=Tritrichomonas foetus TaxID=1144522 RepID=A0A1J4KJZ6_9EUKA|nr:small GTP-binding protein [Tritrichomonas foetus]|eukprot:OHT11547.1 small GTP-binding protein [Tritrichomonas foetus]